DEAADRSGRSIQLIVGHHHGPLEAFRLYCDRLIAYRARFWRELHRFYDGDRFNPDPFTQAAGERSPRRLGAVERHWKTVCRHRFLAEQRLWGQKLRIGVTDPPPLGRLSVILIGDVIQTVAVFDRMLEGA